MFCGEKMVRVGVKEVKNNLSRYLRMVKEGKEVLITEHNKPVALMKKTSRNGKRRKPTEKEILQSLYERGIASPTDRSRRRVRLKPIRIKSGISLSKLVIEERKTR